MARAVSEKCRLCSKVSAAEARQKPCWEDDKCHRRRSDYRRRAKRKGETRAQREGIEMEPSRPTAILYLYRSKADSRLHAIAATLWKDGQPVCEIEPFHTLGLTAKQINTLFARILHKFSESAGREVKFEGEPILLDPQLCPLRPCPLHPHDND